MSNSLECLLDGAPADDPRAGPLRIGVNLFSLVSQGGGMRQYVLQLLPGLLRLSGHQLVLFHHWQSQPSVAVLLRRLSPAERNRVRAVFLDDQSEIFGHAHTFDVLFCPLCALAPDLLDRPTLATLPDIQERFFPHYFSDEQRHGRAYYYPYTAHAATTLLTLSEFSKGTICDAFAVPPQRVCAVHLAPNDEIVDAVPEWPAQLGASPKRYVFYPANLYPHKNHKTLLKALHILNRQRGIDCACLLTGQPSQPGIDIEREIKAHGLEDKVRWLGHVTGNTLRYLYEHAVALCFPSEFEGFGMPLVEAMLCGCPVIAAPMASIPEIAGDAALLIENTPEAFADAIARLLSDALTREDLIARGRIRAQCFNARRLAQETLRAVDEAVARFWQSRACVPGTPPVTFVVHPRTGGRPLAETLARLAFEVQDHDEVLVLARREDLAHEARVLCDNLGVVRYLAGSARPDTWLDEVRNEYLYYLQGGDWICEGATRTALAAFVEHPDCQAVIGEVLLRGGADQLAGVAYLPPRSWGLGPANEAPASAVAWWRAHGLEREGDLPCAGVFWRAAHLREQRGLLNRSAWPAAALKRAGRHVEVRYRAFASVATESPQPLAPVIPASVGGRFNPEPALQRLARATRRTVARQLVRFKEPGRAFSQRLPAWLRRSVRGLYLRMVGPYRI